MMKIPPYSITSYVKETVSRRWFSTSPKKGAIIKTGHFLTKHLIARVSSVALPAIALVADLPGNFILGTLKGASYRFTKDPDLRALRKGIVKEHYKASGQASVHFLKSLALLIPNLFYPRFGFKDFRKHDPEKLEEKAHLKTEGAIRQEKAYQQKKAKKQAQRRKYSGLRRNKEAEERKRKQDAATKIQKVFRRFRVRRAMERDLETFVLMARKRQIREFFESLPAIVKNICRAEELLAQGNAENGQNRLFNTHNPASLIAEHVQRMDPHLQQIEGSIPPIVDLDAEITPGEREKYKQEQKRLKQLFVSPKTRKEQQQAAERARTAAQKSATTPADQVLKLMSDRLDPDLSEVFAMVFDAYKVKYGEDIVKSFEADEEKQTFAIEFTRPIQFWTDAKNDRGKDEPPGGAVMLLGDKNNKLTGRGREMPNGDKKLIFDDGFYSYSKNTEPMGKSRGYPDGMVYCKVESITYTPDGDVITDVVGQNIQLVGFLPVSQALCRKPQKKTIETVKGNWSACEVVEGDYIEFQKGKLTPTR